MKNTITYALLFISSLIWTGCNDWLDLEPENSLTASDFWKDEKDIQAVVTACYGTLANGALADYVYLGELRGGLVSPGSSGTSNRNIMEFFDYNITSTNSMVRWDTYYQVINYSNSILKHADAVTAIDPDLSDLQTNYYKAEALALRALCYLHLVKSFREVPLVLEPFDTDASELQVEKQQEEVIMQQIIADLKQALEWAPVKYDHPVENLGRIRSFTVHAILAEAYLWNNNYEDCITACDAVINSFQFGLVSGRNYLSLFSEGNTSEGIFELQFNHTLGETNSLYALTANLPNGTMLISDYTSELFNDLDDYRGDVVSVDFTSRSIWKYIGANKNDRTDRRERDANWIYYRLADMFLMKAEALAEQGKLAEATVPLNLIRARANLIPASTASDTETFLEILLEERAREFIGEGKRWYDLVRIARRNPDLRKHFILDNVLRNVSPQYISSTEDKIDDLNSWYLPIYFRELETNKKLVQNEFYKKD